MHVILRHLAGPAALALAIATLLGCDDKSGHVDYSLADKTYSVPGSVWESQEEGHPWQTHVSVWSSAKDSRAVMQIDFPQHPGTYACNKMWSSSVDLFELDGASVDLAADWQNDGSSCTLTWSRDAAGRIVGDVSATMTAFDDPSVEAVETSVHFEVDAPAAHSDESD